MSALTTKTLGDIRDEIRDVRGELGDVRGEIRETRESLGARIDGTNERLERLERRQVATEVRLATELVAVTSAIHEVRDVLLEDRRFARRIDNHEERIRALEQRTEG